MVRRDGSPITNGRIRPALETAIRLIVEQGYTIADAAKSVGYREHSLIQALHKPHVRAFRAGVKRAWLDSQTSKAWLTVADLAANAASEDVRLKASRTFLDAAGELTPDAKGQAGPSQLIQIITRAVDIGGQPLDQRLPGVIEAPSYKVIDAKPSDSGEV
jgi:hypothetical protein